MEACGCDPHGLSVLRRTARGITSAMFVRAGETVSRPCLVRTKLEDFFNVLLGGQ